MGFNATKSLEGSNLSKLLKISSVKSIIELSVPHFGDAETFSSGHFHKNLIFVKISQVISWMVKTQQKKVRTTTCQGLSSP